MEQQLQILNERLAYLEKRIQELESHQRSIQVVSRRYEEDPLLEKFYRAQREMTS